MHLILRGWKMAQWESACLTCARASAQTPSLPQPPPVKSAFYYSSFLKTRKLRLRAEDLRAMSGFEYSCCQNTGFSHLPCCPSCTTAHPAGPLPSFLCILVTHSLSWQMLWFADIVGFGNWVNEVILLLLLSLLLLVSLPHPLPLCPFAPGPERGVCRASCFLGCIGSLKEYGFPRG